MSNNATLESRLDAVERDVAELKRRVINAPPEGRPWYERMIGSMKDYPEFEEVGRLGREIRKADSPSLEIAE
jgi:hypothetical protein